MGVLCIQDMTGDTKVMWDAKNADEVAAAKAQFDTLKAKGFLAFGVKKDGEKAERIKAFDPEMEKIIMSPPPISG